MPCSRRILGVADGSQFFARLFSTNPGLLVVNSAELLRRDPPQVVQGWTQAQILAGVGPIALNLQEGWYRAEIVATLQPNEQALFVVTVVSDGVIHSRECQLNGGAAGGADSADIALFMV